MLTSHQAMIFKTDLIDKQRYDESYKITGDFKFILEYLKKVQFPVHVKDTAIQFQNDGISNNKFISTARESFKVRSENDVGLIKNLKVSSVTVLGGLLRSVNPKVFTFLKSKHDDILHKADMPVSDQLQKEEAYDGQFNNIELVLRP